MPTEDKRTRAELIEELAAAREETRAAESAAYHAQQAMPAPLVSVPEATALAQCIRAIDAMQNTSRSSSSANVGYASYGYSGDYPRQQSTVERLLRSLAAKYDVPLVEVRTEPCSRRHLDEISPDRIMQALHA